MFSFWASSLFIPALFLGPSTLATWRAASSGCDLLCPLSTVLHAQLDSTLRSRPPLARVVALVPGSLHAPTRGLTAELRALLVAPPHLRGADVFADPGLWNRPRRRLDRPPPPQTA